MFDQHEVIFSNGVATESFYAGAEAVGSVTDQAREEMFAIFPQLRSDLGQYGGTARLCLRGHEAKLFHPAIPERSLQVAA